jgi:LacI family transcriptional regulator
VAAKLGYHPNPLVSALMAMQRQGRAKRPKHLTLAFVTTFSRGDSWRFYLSPDLVIGAAQRAGSQGYHLEEFWLGDLGVNSARLSQILYERGVPGVIIAPLRHPYGALDLDWSRFSAVGIGYGLTQPELHRISTNRFQAMRLAIRKLREIGYSRLGLAIDINQDARVDHQWAAAFQWEQQEIKRGVCPELFLVQERDWNEKKFSRWFAKNRPEVVLGYDPEIIAWLKNAGKRVPEDVGFVHLWNPDTSGKFAGLFHNPPMIGAAAVDFLVGMIQRNERGVPESPQTSLLTARWVDGATVLVR